MKALVIKSYGIAANLHLKEVSMPVRKKGEVLLRVHAAGTNPVDYKIRNGSLRFVNRSKFPRILGMDISGVVEQTDKNSSFKPGDKVFGMLPFNGGGYAEFVAIKESLLCPVPENIDMIQAAAFPLAALTAFQAIMKCGGIRPNFRVLVNGASGGVGAFAVQLAKAMGATVTAVCSARNVEFVKKIGAHEVIDYNEVNFTKQKKRYNIIIDAVAKSSFCKCKKILAPKGSYITTLPSAGFFLHALFNFARGKKARLIMVKSDGNDLSTISKYMAKGLIRVNIQEVFPLKEGAAAHELLETKRVRGKIVISVQENQQ